MAPRDRDVRDREHLARERRGSERGSDIYAWMEERLDASDHILCVVSDDYLKAPYSTLERNAGLWLAASSLPGFVLLVAVKPCRLPRPQ